MYSQEWGMGPMSLGQGAPEWAWMALGFLGPMFLLVVLWSAVWKGLALWHSGRRGQYWWFIILLVVNTMGILEIIYLFGIAKLKIKDLFSTHSHGHSH